MAAADDRKLYLGPRLRILRRELGLNQTRMAEELGVSPSYLNHLERNQRPLTAQMLLRLANTYDIDVRDFVAGANEAAASGLHEVFADGLVRDIGIPRHEIIEVAENYPSVADAITRLYRALGDLRAVPDRVVAMGGAGGAVAASPIEWLREAIEARHGYLDELDLVAEALSATLGDGPDAIRAGMVERLAARGVSVRVVPPDLLAGTLRHYDFHRRRLMLSELLPPESRLFGIAHQLALTELWEAIAAALGRAAPPDEEAALLGRIACANYAAAALLMPYARFREAAEATRHDVALLARRFGVSWEQAAQRLTSLRRPGAAGVPFFLLAIDAAGNVAKRVVGDAAPIARFGGGCPRWRAHRTRRLPGETIAELVETPDGARYVTVARAVPRPARREPVTVVIGCEARHAERIAAVDGLAEVTPIGPACHLCERPDCAERSLPPVTRALDLNQYQRPIAPYPFRAA